MGYGGESLVGPDPPRKKNSAGARFTLGPGPVGLLLTIVEKKTLFFKMIKFLFRFYKTTMFLMKH